MNKYTENEFFKTFGKDLKEGKCFILRNYKFNCVTSILEVCYNGSYRSVAVTLNGKEAQTIVCTDNHDKKGLMNIYRKRKWVDETEITKQRQIELNSKFYNLEDKVEIEKKTKTRGKKKKV